MDVALDAVGLMQAHLRGDTEGVDALLNATSDVHYMRDVMGMLVQLAVAQLQDVHEDRAEEVLTQYRDAVLGIGGEQGS